MNANVTAVINQVIIIFIFVIIGFALFKTKKLTEKGAAQITGIILSIVNPCVIINAFITSFTADMLPSLLKCFAAAILIHIAGIFLGKIVFKSAPEGDKSILQFGLVYSNCGFMALPIIEAVLGQQGVVYGSVYIAVFNCFSWTVGLNSILGKGKGKKISSKVLFNPGVISIAVSMALVLFNIKLPYVVNQPVSMISALNTPLAMMITGSYLASAGLKRAFTDKRTYLISFFRLLVLPALMAVMMYFMGISAEAIKALVISAGAPTASITVLFASTYNKNSSLAGGIIAVTTLLSMITLPALVLLSEYVFDFCV